MGKFRGLDTDPGWESRRIKALEDAVAELSAARVLTPDNLRYKADGVTLASTWALIPSVASSRVPVGFTRAQVVLYSSTGASFSGTGSAALGTQGVVNYSGGAYPNDAISNGTTSPAPISAVSNSSVLITGLNGGTLTVDLYAYCAVSGLSIVAGSGNLHMSAQILYLR